MQKSNPQKAACICLAVIIFISLAGCGTPIEASSTPSVSTPTPSVSIPEPSIVPITDEEAIDSSTENMVQNGDFSDMTSNWHLYLARGGSADLTAENEEGVINIKSPGMSDYSVQLYYDGFKLETGGVYRFAFDMKCTMNRNISARLQINGGDYSAYIENFIDITTDMERYEIKFTMEAGTDPAPRLCFNIGTPQDGSEVGPCKLTVDNVEVTLIDGSNILQPEPEPVRPDININQIGYEPDDKKIAVFRGDQLADSFQVLDEDEQTVLEGALSEPIQNESAGETNYIGDFSSLTAKGTYHIVCGNAIESYPFEVAENVYDDAFKSVFQMLYLQRCGCEIDPEIAGDYAHAPCHTDEAIIYGTDEKKDVSGGWHDAGDYGRYVVPGAKAVADLLIAYDDFGDILGGENGDEFGIPESGNGVPDILDEARYELDWMLKMQDKSGGVYHKVTGLDFPGEVMPTEETEQLYILPVSFAATGDFCAVMAMASEAYKPFDKAFAKTCLDASLKAWGYLEDNAGQDFENPEDVLTGEYGDGQDADERYWGAAELYKVTGKAKYKEVFERYLDLFVYVFDGYGWNNVGGYANRAYLSMDSAKIDSECAEKIIDSLSKKADDFVTNASLDGYGLSLGLSYPWGSNMTVCNNAIYLNDLSTVTGNDYSDTINSHFNYIFGANPMSICYVTGYGSVSPQQPHHRPSMVVGSAMPGMLIGGPNSNLEDPYAKAVLAEAPPAKCYADNSQSFSCNEITIYWNSPLIYLMALHMSE